MNDSQGRLIIVSNRLPIKLQRESGEWKISPGSGGLVTAMVPVLRNRGGIWIGWPGVVKENSVSDLDALLADVSKDFGYEIEPVELDEADRDNFYYGFSNEIIWPLFHDLQTLCNFAPEYWKSYLDVNKRFAEAVARRAGDRDYIWVHDYHLMPLAAELRRRSIQSPVGFFLHIPFPPLDIFLKVPWRLEILRLLLEYDLIGLQTSRDRRNFLHCVEAVVPDAVVSEGKDHEILTIQLGSREVRVGSFPISIDFKEFEKAATSREVADTAWYIHENLPQRQIVLGIDRLDYTKGIPYRLKAFGNALERYPELRGKMSLVQVVVPSRTDVPQYQALREEIERLVGEINGRFTQPGWIPIHYIFRSLSRSELLGHYRAAEIALITPLKDGMNLIAKEYCACNVGETGCLILSEFAGAAPQLQTGALLVNPYHIEEVADAIYEAYQMDAGERRKRMKKLREAVRTHDIFWWVDSFLGLGISKSLEDFPVLEEYIPRLDIEPDSGE